ncbi:hypothetical protein [Alicyclobacillus herbarius]|uniref:hypothetical protein n=1 Tax=Alicyclobacillus herbarius TaxID=122960 RepID=UPI00040F1BD7|nr:hypothetical protein [Alicyclobacillus herbarius]
MEQWAQTFQPQAGTDIESITVEVVAEDFTGTLHVTDIMLQGGNIATTWVGHPSEIRWSFDSE